MTGAIRIIIAVMATALLLFLYSGSRGLDPQRTELEDTGTLESLPLSTVPEEEEDQSEPLLEGPDPDNSIVLPEEQEAEPKVDETPNL